MVPSRSSTGRTLLLTLALGASTSHFLLRHGVHAVSNAADAIKACAASGAYCGNHNDGANCCPSGQYCQPWNEWYYQCIDVPAQSNTPEVGYDYWGDDIADYDGFVQPADCIAKCVETSGCAAYSFVNNGWDGKTHCYLKSGTGSGRPAVGVVSATVKTGACNTPTGAYCGNSDGTMCCQDGAYCQIWDPWYYQCIDRPAQCSEQLTDVDFYGNDMGVKYGLHPWECCDKCAETEGCVGYTFVNNNPGSPACYLKSSLVGNKTAKGCVSGVVDSPLSVSSHIQARIRSGAAKVRSVNLGGWLVSEYWLSYDSVLWKDVPSNVSSKGEYSTMQYLGKEAGTAAFEAHRQTWITEDDIAEIAATGVLNAVRVPVGHWIALEILDDMTGTEGDMYAPGGLEYLDTLINDWAVKYNLAVMLSLHAHQGSQNGYEHSSPSAFDSIMWSDSQDNIDNSLEFATALADRYKDSEAFLGLNLMNEPRTPLDQTKLLNYYTEAYRRIRNAGNNCILGISPYIGQQGPDWYNGVMPATEYTNVWNEFHPYFIWGFETYTEEAIIAYIDTYKQTHLDANPNGNRLLLGEWCMGGPPDQNGVFQNVDNFHELGRKQLQLFSDYATGGWAFWTWRHLDEGVKRTGWSLRYLIRNGDLVLV